MEKEEILWWCFICILFILTLISLVFSILAFNDSQISLPCRNLQRNNICARNNIRSNGLAHLHHLKVCACTNLKKTNISALTMNDVQVITLAGTFELSKCFSVYRIDTEGSNTIDLFLPLVSDVPGHMYQIIVSQSGSNNTVNINVATGDYYCNTTCTQVNPVYTLPTNAANADEIILRNDSVDSWFGNAHT